MKAHREEGGRKPSPPWWAMPAILLASAWPWLAVSHLRESPAPYQWPGSRYLGAYGVGDRSYHLVEPFLMRDASYLDPFGQMVLIEPGVPMRFAAW